MVFVEWDLKLWPAPKAALAVLVRLQVFQGLDGGEGLEGLLLCFK